ncbi:MAG: hypothetical protein ACI88L_000419 [Candidatus Paceibacteria bacterium]|jgi:hypothetical protein
MKKIFTILIVVSAPFVSTAQIVQISSGDPLPAISSPAVHESIGYFNISSDSTVFVEECKIGFTEGFEFIDRVYLNIDESPYSSWSSEFLLDPLIHYPSFLINFEGEENAFFEYFADIEAGVASEVDISYSITCKIYPYGNSSQFVWTEPIQVSTPVYTYVANAGKSSRLSIRGKSILIPKHLDVSFYDMTGKEVLFIPASHTEKKYSLDLQTGIYFLIANNKFSGRFSMIK